MEKVFVQLEELGLFKWLDEEHNYAINNRNLTSEYLDKLPITAIHRTVMNACAFRWFREKYQKESYINKDMYDKYWYYIPFIFGAKQERELYCDFFDTPQEAELECLKKLIEIVKNK
jgi:predicted GNAT superfamily acetyltransferase